MKLPHNRGYSKDRGSIESLLAAVLDYEVEERIGGGETSFWDKQAVEQGLVINPLGLPRNEPVWISKGGGAGSLSFGWGRLPWGHGGRSRARDLQTLKKNERGRGKGGQIRVGRK